MLDPENEHAFLRDELKCYILLYLGRYIQGLVSVFLEHKVAGDPSITSPYLK